MKGFPFGQNGIKCIFSFADSSSKLQTVLAVIHTSIFNQSILLLLGHYDIISKFSVKRYVTRENIFELMVHLQEINSFIIVLNL